MEHHQTRWPDLLDRWPWWSHVPQQKLSSLHGVWNWNTTICNPFIAFKSQNEIQVFYETHLYASKHNQKYSRSKTFTVWRLGLPLIFAQNPNMQMVHQLNRHQQVYPNRELKLLAEVHHQTMSAPNWRSSAKCVKTVKVQNKDEQRTVRIML